MSPDSQCAGRIPSRNRPWNWLHQPSSIFDWAHVNHPNLLVSGSEVPTRPASGEGAVIGGWPQIDAGGCAPKAPIDAGGGPYMPDTSVTVSLTSKSN